MKKVLIATIAILASCIIAEAATIKWTVEGVYDPSANSGAGAYFNGAVTLYCATAGFEDWEKTGFVLTDGELTSSASSFTDDSFDGVYDFYFVATNDRGETFTSYTFEDVKISSIGVARFDFDYDTIYAASSNPDNWKAVPEPTSGLLLLLGMAGLALRRKRA